MFLKIWQNFFHSLIKVHVTCFISDKNDLGLAIDRVLDKFIYTVKSGFSRSVASAEI